MLRNLVGRLFWVSTLKGRGPPSPRGEREVSFGQLKDRPSPDDRVYVELSLQGVDRSLVQWHSTGIIY